MSGLRGTKLNSICTGSCPVCQKVPMYLKKNPYFLNQTLAMHETCSHCGMKFKIEPSFFYGAMYVSYGVGVAFAIATFIITYFFLNFSRLQAFIAIVLVLILTLTIILRLSRNIWINFFFKYDKNKANKND